jgi:hypothetical protein
MQFLDRPAAWLAGFTLVLGADGPLREKHAPAATLSGRKR